MYAVFEQPDLKAPFPFTVTAPAHWQVISNSPTPHPEPAGDGSRTRQRSRRPNRISSYSPPSSPGPPTGARRGRVLSRRGAARRLLPEVADAVPRPRQYLRRHQEGLRLLRGGVRLAYPFEKYDQLFAPEYNMGAMENAGRGDHPRGLRLPLKLTEAHVERRALTVLHELAHMWFGNLVTMRWWTTSGSTSPSPSGPPRPASPRPPTGPTPGRPSAPTRRTGPTARTSSPSTHPIVAEIRHLRTSRSTSTASPTPRAPRCSSSSSPTSAASRSATACAPTSPSTPGATRPSTTCSASSRRPPAATCAPGPSCGSRPPASTRCAPSSRSTTEARHLLGRDRADLRPGLATLRPHRLGIGAVCRRATASLDRTDRLEVDVDGRAHRGARARRPRAARPAAGQRRRPRLRQDPPRRALARDGAGPPARLPDSLPRSLVLGARGT